MTTQPFTIRSYVGILLILVLTLSGAARGTATVSALPGNAIEVAGVLAPICHTGQDDGSRPAGRSDHACCDACLLLAPIVLTPPAHFPARLPTAAALPHLVDATAGFRLARWWTPCQARAPPGA